MNNEIYSTVPQIYDYLSIQGLNTKYLLNSTDFDIFIIKELMDNALDHIEENTKEFVNGKQPFVHVNITEEENGEIIKIRFRNSNASIKNIFTEDRVNQIFILQNKHGNKRYRHKINRGELGDALKAILCIPYAIAVNNYNKNKIYQTWNYPLEINVSNDNRSIKISIDNIDKVRRKENLDIDKKYSRFQNISDYEDINDYNHFTEIVVYLPKIAVDYYKIDSLLKKYAILNTHINFKFKLPFRNESDFYLATQRIKNNWRNKESIYSYTLSELDDYIQSTDKSHDNQNVYDNFLYTNFREGTNLSKKDDKILKNLTFADLKYDVSKIEYIMQKMKDAMRPIKKQSSSLIKLDLPFDTESREQALKRRLEDVYLTEDFIYRRFDNEYYEDSNPDIQFPYKLEVIIAKSPILDENLLTLIESINFSTSLHNDSFFGGDDHIFHTKQYRHNTLSSILSECGYSILNKSEHKKPYNLVIVNLISPRIDYNGLNKSKINIVPFVETFSKKLYKFCKSPNNNNNKNKSNNNNSNNDSTNIGQLRILLKERLEDIKNDPSLLEKGEWTMSTVFYTLRKLLIEKRIPVGGREYITGEIKKVCKELGYKRHQLGIIAAERAQLYFKGEFRGVNLDDIPNLAKMGTDLIIIEKEGAVKALGPFADKYGIALLNTRGFLTEYAIDVAKETGSNISILSDFDVSGLLLATKASDNIHRLGIDFQTIQDLGLDIETVQEEYTPEHNSHYKHLKEKTKNDPKLKNQLDYLKHYRIEIDSVLAEIGNEEFWDYIIQKLVEIFPYRNYNRAIDIDKKSIIPDSLQEFINNTNKIIHRTQEPERQKIMNELENVMGLFDDVEELEIEFEDRLRSIVENNPEVKNKISEEFKKLFG